MRDENDTTTADLLDRNGEYGDTGPDTRITVAGFGTGTVAELEAHLAQITDERDTLQKEAHSSTTSAALGLYDAVSYAAHTSADDLRAEVSALTADLRAVKTELESMRRELGDIDTAGEIDGGAIWREIEYRVREAAEEAAEEASGEIDGGAFWAAISDRVDEAAAEAARQVIRDELVASVDLI